MTALLANFGSVLDFVIASLTTVVNTIVAEPLLLLFLAVGVAGMIFGWVRSLIHV